MEYYTQITVNSSRQGLVVIELEDPWLIPRILPHMSKWEVADVQWSPHIARESWVASTVNICKIINSILICTNTFA